ncbi:MAG: sorbitol dehydrogenase [Dehalococcoidia bacterium]|nr:MAG: sorbitol dehydrogenase [Dehalococcoidia bacterium]
MRYQGKTVIVTGGGSGIGRAICERFAREGANVTIADRNGAGARALAEELGERALAYEVDVTDAAAMEDLVATTVARFGGLDIMVNNAGIILIAPVVETDFAAWRQVLEVNLNGVFLGARAAARQLIAQGRGGVIINGSSGAGRRGVANLAAYCASKAGVISLTQTLALELAPHRIRVNAYTPGHILTPFWETIADGFAGRLGVSREAVIEQFRRSVPWGRFGTPEEVAHAVAWLASDEAEYISGQCLAMNGAEFLW